jgi:hypothetical protein
MSSNKKDLAAKRRKSGMIPQMQGAQKMMKN